MVEKRMETRDGQCAGALCLTKKENSEYLKTNATNMKQGKQDGPSNYQYTETKNILNILTQICNRYPYKNKIT